MTQAIETRLLPATNSHGSRIVAKCAAKRVVSPRGHKAQNLDDDHRDAAIDLILKLGWHGHWVQGCLASGDFVFVCQRRSGGGNTEGFDVWEGMLDAKVPT